jgi:hypothetical protein
MCVSPLGKALLLTTRYAQKAESDGKYRHTQLVNTNKISTLDFHPLGKKHLLLEHHKNIKVEGLLTQCIDKID